MSSYTVYDFAESLGIAGIDEADVKSAIAAWGYSSGEWAEWEGGFILEMKDGRFAYIWGWCDTSGWGCQDGAQVEYYDTEPQRIIKRSTPMHMGGYIEALMGGKSAAWEQDWDEDPADLNLYLAGEIGKTY